MQQIRKRHGRGPMLATMLAALALAGCASQTSPASTSLDAQAHPTVQCRFATTADDWHGVTAQLGQQATRLRVDGMAHAPDIMTRVLDLGAVQVRSAKPTAAISRVGIPNKLPAQWTAPTGDAAKDAQQRERNRANGNGYFEGEIDLRFRFPAWAHGFAVVEPTADGCIRRSLVFFDAAGEPIHTVTLANTSHVADFDRLVADFRHAEPTVPTLEAPASAPPAPATPDAAVDLAAYHQAWQGITDVHQFNRIMRDFKLSRVQALRLAPPGSVRPLAPAAMQALLEQAAAQGLPIMVFLSNGAVTQIHAGPIHNLRQAGEWLVVDDPTSHIALHAGAIASAWQIERGGIYSVDFYDASDTLIASFFGVRSREHPVPQEWIALVKALPSAP